ncbi:hypothetical protein DRQ20_00705 [bacterium]|nr:MAG: hypothetical protein DRQ20_00705 [bacterium]
MGGRHNKGGSLRIGVLGSVHRDILGQEEYFGGIVYNLLPLSGLEAYPITWAGRDKKEEFEELLSVLGVKKDGIFYCEKFNRNTLIYHGEERDEILEANAPEISREQIDFARSMDFLLVNFIRGDELTQEEFASLAGDGRMVDVHSLTLGVDKRGRRYPREIKEWFDVIVLFPFVQGNQRELHLLTGESGERAIRKLMNAGVEAVFMTMGKKGVLLGYKGKTLYIPAREREGDPTGAGDIFSGAFIRRHTDRGCLPFCALCS